MNDGRRASLAPAPAEMPETQRGLGNATVERREADVPVARDGQPRKREVASYRRDELRRYASRRSAGSLISGSEPQLTPRIWARAPPKRRPRQRRCGGDKEQRRDNPGAETRRGNEMRCAADAAGRAV